MIVTFTACGFLQLSCLLRGGLSADCDRDGALTVSDFTCYLERFAAGEVYADAAPGTAAPMLNVADFTAFLRAFAAGRVEPEPPAVVLEGAVVLGSGWSGDEYRLSVFGLAPAYRVTVDLRWPAAAVVSGPDAHTPDRAEFLFPP